MFPRNDTLARALANANRRQLPPPLGNYGTAPDGTPVQPIDLIFSHPEQNRLDPGFHSLLDGVSDKMGRDLTITSGYRGHNHPVEARKPGGPGMHSTGQAADISMAGMDEATRQRLINELHGAGALRFGTYSGSPNMLHVDMKNQHGNSQPHFMFDRTAAKMGNAPGYYRAVAGDLGGQPVNPATMHGGSVDETGPEPQGLLAFLTGETNDTKATDDKTGQKKKTPGEAIADGLKQAAKGFGSAARRPRTRTQLPQNTFVSAQAAPWVNPIDFG